MIFKPWICAICHPKQVTSKTTQYESSPWLWRVKALQDSPQKEQTKTAWIQGWGKTAQGWGSILQYCFSKHPFPSNAIRSIWKKHTVVKTASVRFSTVKSTCVSFDDLLTWLCKGGNTGSGIVRTWRPRCCLFILMKNRFNKTLFWNMHFHHFHNQLLFMSLKDTAKRKHCNMPVTYFS